MTTLTPKTAPGLDPESYYILDCAVELGELTPLEAQVFRANTPAAHQFARRGDHDILPPHWLRNTARDFLDNLSVEARYVWALHSIPGVEAGLQLFQQRLEFVVQTKAQTDLGIRKPFRLDFVEETRDPVFDEVYFPSVHDITPATVTRFIEALYGAQRVQLATDIDVVYEALSWLQSGNIATARRLARELGLVSADSDFAHPPTVQQVYNNLAAKKRKQQKARGAIKKAVKLFTRMGREQHVRLMVHGQEVVLSNPDSPFKFVLKPHGAGWLEEKTVTLGGHVPYQLSLYTKDDVFLARLCVLFDQTPVLDQLLALTMFVQAGDELELLKTANWFGVVDAPQVREVLSLHAPVLIEKVPLPLNGKGPLSAILEDSGFWKEHAHWEPYKAPVTQWVKGWLGDLYGSLAGLSGTSVPRLSAL